MNIGHYTLTMYFFDSSYLIKFWEIGGDRGASWATVHEVTKIQAKT